MFDMKFAVPNLGTFKGQNQVKPSHILQANFVKPERNFLLSSMSGIESYLPRTRLPASLVQVLGLSDSNNVGSKGGSGCMSISSGRLWAVQ